MIHPRNGFIAEDLEESVAAPSCGDGAVSLIGVTIDASITVAVIYYAPPRMPEIPT